MSTSSPMTFPLRYIRDLIRAWLGPTKQPPIHCRRRRRQLWLEYLEDRLAPAIVSDGGTAGLSILLGGSENLGIVSNGTSYIFSSDKNFTAASGTDPANQGTAFSGVGSSTLSLTSAGLTQYSTGISITGGKTVSFNGGTFTSSFDVNSGGTVSFNGVSSVGDFNLKVSTTLNIVVNPQATISSHNGNITLQANQQTNPTSGSFTGIGIYSATIQSTGSGEITINGKGGDAGYSEGVAIGGATIIGGMGAVDISGSGGEINTIVAFGVSVYGSGSLVTSAGGDVRLTGQGSGSSPGVLLDSNIKVTAGGLGNVMVQGTGGPVDNSENDYGVWFEGFSNDWPVVTSGGGNVQVIGQGGPGTNSDGVELDGQISAGGIGNVTVQGTGGGGLATNDIGSDSGVVIGGSNFGISSAGGNVLVIGTGGGTSGGTFGFAKDYDVGVSVARSGVSPQGVIVPSLGIRAGGMGTVTVIGTGGQGVGPHNFGVDVGGEISSGGGNVQITAIEGSGSNALNLVAEARDYRRP